MCVSVRVSVHVCAHVGGEGKLECGHLIRFGLREGYPPRKGAKQWKRPLQMQAVRASVFISNILRHMEEATHVPQEECPVTWASGGTQQSDRDRKLAHTRTSK